MVFKILTGLRPTKDHLAFVLVAMSVLGMFVLSWFKGVDILSTLPVVIGLYLGTRASEKISAHISSSKDPNCDTAEVIKSMEEK